MEHKLWLKCHKKKNLSWKDHKLFLTKLNVAEIKLENGDLNKGDTILVTSTTTGVVEYNCDKIRVDLKVAEKATLRSTRISWRSIFNNPPWWDR